MATDVALSTLDRRARTRGGTRLTVYELLRVAIVRAELEPGLRLSENELAARLGVSRTPVREALLRLSDEGLVHVVPQLGTFVARIHLPAVQDAHFVRESLERAAVRLAATRAGEGDLLELDSLLARQREAGARGDVDAFYALDDQFHRTLCGLSGHQGAWTVTQRVNHHLNRVRRLSLLDPDYVPEMIDDHQGVVEALRERDPDLSEERLRLHLSHTLSGLPGIRRRHPEFFDEETQ